ncbi:penicillin-binding protein [Aquibium oceanicum]|uniref:Penicillin-binding protein n=2 Tax=Aquibium oceanicum TaxID=1670800 RepID=A0A1L3STE4_9HYPH|nr:penicillin-binding protein [Aquibium oceanicum]
MAADRLRRFFLSFSLMLIAVALGACSTSEVMRTSAPVPTSASSKYAAIVIDANSGRTLHAVAADEPRYPASLTKMMTLYMVFEAIQQGRMTPSTQIPVSAYAASRPPTKLYLKAGQSVDADTAMRSLATKSANDVATAVAEYLGGSETRFADMMTAKARQLGMTHTVFRNASGLPDAQQRTTARDMAVLSLALRRHFPSMYGYFGLRGFAYRGKTIRGHNKVLDMVSGADGIKTGYTRASGFNLATSVSRDGKRLVAVVMGEKTARERDALMAQLVERFLPEASRR